MTRIVSGLMFYILYNAIYFIPLLIAIFIIQAIGVDIPKLLESYGSLKNLILLLFLAYAILPIYRAKLASDAYGERDMLFWEAHTVSGTMLRTQLSFLPVIGKIFELKK